MQEMQFCRAVWMRCSESDEVEEWLPERRRRCRRADGSAVCVKVMGGSFAALAADLDGSRDFLVLYTRRAFLCLRFGDDFKQLITKGLV